MQSKVLTIFLAFILPFTALKSQTKADDIIGIWLTPGKEPAKIQIYKSGVKYYGKIVWLKNPTDNGKPKVDGNNPDKSKRRNPVMDLVLLSGFKFDGDDEWKGGDIYDPESGKTYDSYLYLKDNNTLKVRGYIGISLFGRTETWIRTN
jgi:uncharacterized protein (DUF2147 family)